MFNHKTLLAHMASKEYNQINPLAWVENSFSPGLQDMIFFANAHETM